MNIPGFFDKDVTPLIVVNWSDALKEEGDWQVIYKAKSGKDYARFTYPKDMSLAGLGKEVHRVCFLHDLAGAVIEKW